MRQNESDFTLPPSPLSPQGQSFSACSYTSCPLGNDPSEDKVFTFPFQGFPQVCRCSLPSPVLIVLELTSLSSFLSSASPHSTSPSTKLFSTSPPPSQLPPSSAPTSQSRGKPGPMINPPSFNSTTCPPSSNSSRLDFTGRGICLDGSPLEVSSPRHGSGETPVKNEQKRAGRVALPFVHFPQLCCLLVIFATRSCEFASLSSLPPCVFARWISIFLALLSSASKERFRFSLANALPSVSPISLKARNRRAREKR